MKNRLLIVICFTALMLITSTAFAAEKRRVEVKAKSVSQSAEHRIALVIGNANYRIGALRNPANDARAIAAALRALDFEVDEQINLSYQEMGRAVNRFGKSIRKDSVALFYYAGHGLQVQGSNYLVPVDMEIQDEGEVQFNTVNAGQVLAKMEEAKNPVNIVILDACRDNPYARGFKRSSGSRGLAAMDAPVGSFVAYAAAPGKTAADGSGKNGLYTESLIRQIRTPGMKIEDVFKRVRTEVRSKSNGSQVPEERSSLEGEFYFRPGKGEPTALSKETEPTPASVTGSIMGSGRASEPLSSSKTSPVVEPAKPADELDLVLAQVEQKKASEEQRKREAREAEERQKEEQSRQFRNLLDDLKKYEAIRSADIDGEKKAAAWRALARKYPAWSAGASVDGPDDLMATALTEDKDGAWLQMATSAGMRSKFTSPALGATFALIPAGTFTMGSPAGEQGRDNDEIQHQVTISNHFYLQTTEVTQGQWQKVMGNNPSNFKNCGVDCPVEQVSWNDVQEFIRKLNSMEGTDRYRLPTEAQWEYAARAGTTTRFHSGDKDDDLSLAGWFDVNSGSQTHPVAQKTPNSWGLYDMHGNVWEWVHDWKGDYPSGSVIDPAGPSSGSYRVYRGGSWNDYARYSRSAYRYNGVPGFRYDYLGFRLLRTR